MSLFNYTDDTVTVEEINALIENKVSEKKTIEYKLDIVLNTDEQKKEFLADVISFANTDGGVIIYGIKELEGFPTSIVGLQNENQDTLKGKIESIIRDGIQPKLNIVRVLILPLNSNHYLLILKIPKSWVTPHLIWYKKSSKFYARNSSHGKYQLEIQEIRSSILASETLIDKIRNFRLERLSKILNNETPVTISNEPKFVLHIVPLSSFSIKKQIETSKFNSLIYNPNPLSDFRMQYNFDGFVLHNVYESYPADRYIQIFRNGIIELVNTNFTDIKDNVNLIFGKKFEGYYISEVPKYVKLLNFLGYDFPLIIILSVLNIKDYKFYVLDEYSFRISNNPIDRDNLLLPELMVEENPNTTWDVLLKDTFDSLYYACGIGGSLNYDSNGRWIGVKK